MFNPASILTEFVNKLLPSLSSVTSLLLDVESEAGSKEEDVALLVEAQASLLASCPTLNSLSYAGHLSPELVKEFGEACPNLVSLEITGWDQDPEEEDEESGVEPVSNLQRAVPLLPSLLPSVSCLTLSPCEVDRGWELPDMSRCSGIGILDVEGMKLEVKAY
ncbi:MAG: hypothetical protein WDW38_006128 [Sanguina aurantia]